MSELPTQTLKKRQPLWAAVAMTPQTEVVEQTFAVITDVRDVRVLPDAARPATYTLLEWNMVLVG